MLKLYTIWLNIASIEACDKNYLLQEDKKNNILKSYLLEKVARDRRLGLSKAVLVVDNAVVVVVRVEHGMTQW